MTIAELIVSALMIVATIFMVATLFALWRAPDDLTRINVMGTTTCVAVPIYIMAALVHEWGTTGFNTGHFLRGLLAILALWIVVSVGSFYIGRSVYGITVTDRRAGGESNQPVAPTPATPKEGDAGRDEGRGAGHGEERDGP